MREPITIIRARKSRILVGDVRRSLQSLPAGRVHSAITSPPYWGLRAYGTDPQIWGGDPACAHEWGDTSRKHPLDRGGEYGGGKQLTNAGTICEAGIECGACGACGAWRGELGSEPTPDLYVAHIVEVFAEVWRVLRNDGTLWLNIGDCYCSTAPGTTGDPLPRGDGIFAGVSDQRAEASKRYRPKTPAGLKPKDLVGIPWRVAFALQAWGWYLRSEIIWAKRSPMPESATDRPCKSHEQVFLFSKRPTYFYDRVAVMEPTTGGAHSRGNGVNPKSRNGVHGTERQNASFSASVIEMVTQRNLRSVWSLSNQPYKGAHFATFPPNLVIPCIKAGTSEHGCCPECGAPWRRLIKRVRVPTRSGHQTKVKVPSGWDTSTGNGGHGSFHKDGRSEPQYRERIETGNRDPQRHESVVETIGWEPTCQCGCAERVPATVLDPFLGSGTTAAVANYLHREAIGCELNASYADQARQRIEAGYIPPKQSKAKRARRAIAKLQQVLFA